MTTGQPVPGSVGSNDDPKTGRVGLGRLDQGMSFLAGAEGLRIGREGLEPIQEFLNSEPDRPFFLWYAPMLPHSPHNPPMDLLEKYKAVDRPERVARYMAMCEWFDQTCGELLGMLDDAGVSENTLVAFVVDNGYVQMPDINWFDAHSKLSPYEAGVRTPILLRWPGHITPGRHDDLVHSIDLAPTILAASGVEPPEDLPGVNLLKVLQGKPVTRDTIYGAMFRFKAEKPVEPSDTVDYRWCVNDRWKLIVPRDPDASLELYDVVDDPHEKRDVMVDRPDMVRRLQTKLDLWWPAAARTAETTLR